MWREVSRFGARRPIALAFTVEEETGSPASEEKEGAGQQLAKILSSCPTGVS